MPDRQPFNYAVLRIVPHVERGEFVNAGVVLFCRPLDFLGVRIRCNRARLQALFPDTDVDTAEAHLRSIEAVCRGEDAAGPLGRLSKSERFSWCVAPGSAMIQPSEVHSGLTADPAGQLDQLFTLFC